MSFCHSYVIIRSMTSKTKASQQKPTEQDPLVALAEVLTQIARRENIIDTERLRREAKD